MINNNLIDFYAYIRPILNSCLGFIKTEGYFTHYPGYILAMSADETVFIIIQIPIIYNIYITSTVKRFLQLKTQEEQSNLFNEIYFTGWNIKNSNLLKYNKKYSILKLEFPIFEEPDCYNMYNFKELSKSIEINKIDISDGNKNYIIPVSKSITPVNKDDNISLKLYNGSDARVKIVNYTIFKKKLKLNIDIFTNILVF